MSKLQQPLKVLRQRYSVQLNHGRELLARNVSRAQELTRFVEDTERWDRESAVLAGSTFEGETHEYSSLYIQAGHGHLEQELHELRAGIAANVRALEALEARLVSAKSGCLGL